MYFIIGIVAKYKTGFHLNIQMKTSFCSLVEKNYYIKNKVIAKSTDFRS